MSELPIVVSASPRLRAQRSAFRMTVAVAVFAAIVVALIFARLIVVAAIVGIGIGVILAPVLKTMHRRLRIPRGLAAALVAAAAITLMGLVAWSIFSVVESQVAQLAERTPELLRRLQDRVSGLLSRYAWLKQSIETMDLAAGASGMGGLIFKGAWSGIGVLSALVFALVIGLYVAVDAEEYREGAVRAFPAPHRERAADLLKKSAITIRIWFRAQLIDMLIIGTLTSLGLWIVGADYWLLFGVLTGLLGIIPYVGIAIVVVFAALITLASDPSRLPWVLGVFLATQQLEGNLILPLVMRGSAKIPAMPLLVFMLLMGTWAGLLGVLIAPPLFAVICLVYRELYLPRMDAAHPAAVAAPPRNQRATGP